MRHALLLAARYLAYRRGRAVVIALGVAATVLLPLAAQVLVAGYSERLAARAAATPLVAGAPGSRYDLVLSTLYFTGRTPRPLSMRDVEALARDGLATPIPLRLGARARDWPVVGTTPDYADFRGLAPAAGTWPLLLGDATLGAEVAAALGLAPGDALLTDQENLYDLARGYPLRMRVAGVLAPTGTADDGAVFVDLKTAWVIEGLGHGHRAAGEMDPAQVVGTDAGAVVLDASVREYTEITDENRASFHLHGGPEDRPVTGVLVVPASAKGRTLLKGRYRVSEAVQLVEPAAVVAELLGFVFRLKVFFDANAVLVWVATGLFLAVIVLLSLEARRREMQTLRRIGCARGTIALVVGTELALVVLAGLAAAAALAAAVVALVRGAVGI